MKQYLVNEDELRILAGKIQFGYAESDIRNFLKDKQEVELIFNDKFHYGEFIVDSEKKKYADFDYELSSRNNKNIKLYVGVQNESK